jgi:F0F1-type ATP synthase assembly protein I
MSISLNSKILRNLKLDPILDNAAVAVSCSAILLGIYQYFWGLPIFGETVFWLITVLGAIICLVFVERGHPSDTGTADRQPSSIVEP